jgi:AraC-like DNA-binding protein
MSYREYLPHPALQSYIDAYWTVRVSGEGTPYTHRILPDCCTDLIYNMGTTIYGANENKVMLPEESYLVGTMTTYRDTIRQSGSSTIGIRFKPGGISAFYRLDLKEATNQAVPYEDKQLFEIICKRKDVRRKLDSYFLNRLNTRYLPIMAVMEDITAYKGQLSVSDLISRHAMSERTLERVFKQHTGVSIKGMMRLVRFTNVLDTIKNNSTCTNLTSIAYTAGYYDQAHLCNEVKSFTGLTPAQL